MATPPRQLLCGLDYATVPNIDTCLRAAHDASYLFIMAPLVNPRFTQEFVSGAAKNREGPFTRPDLMLRSSDWNRLIIGKLSPTINVDSPIPHVRANSEAALHQEISFASHLSIMTVTFQLTGGLDRNMNLARIVCDKMTTASILKFLIQVPMENPLKQSLSYRTDEEISCESPWEWWNGFRNVCDTDRKLRVALVFSADLPDEAEIQRWIGEPVRALIIPTSLFLTNRKGFPVLSKAHQSVIHRFSSLNVRFIITGANRATKISLYQSYLDYLWKREYASDGPLERFCRGYEDYLQVPLQPLKDNLDSSTYEVFEGDPVKYAKYQTAIFQAIVYKMKNSKGQNSPKESCPNDGCPDTSQAFTLDQNRNLIITVVGAGRGPLVRAALQAADMAKARVRVYAVEKNPNAIVTLHALKADIFGPRVTIVACDMRDWKSTEMADILVSELLGSFGDNELSPECLDGAQNFLKDDGISIPQRYTSYIAPVQSAKLYQGLKALYDKEKPPQAHFETPHVVYLQSKYDIAPVQALFTFSHPNRDSVIDNSRYEVKTFNVQQNSVLHGFSGYFDVVLFENVKLSIVPASYSTGMVSWFPIFFPIKEPVQLKAGDEIKVHFWRRCTSKNVWYEWTLSKPIPGSIHNPNGRSSTIEL
ncbi:protein arginine N-methyltransferase 5 [Fopius arisanus]|uniref:Protein arginine N-methyltransferase n=1 Tax=Fopius arisanus TaxID=64838 RepID=A0A0C9RQJ5_9HYME|nr:PREDICTED: protein arginine N-methyltransferase 5 [Fopius arisanus]